MTDEQLIENLRARMWACDCEAAAFRIEDPLARVAELEAERAEREKQEPVAWMEWAENAGAWFLAYSENPDVTTKPLYAAPPVAAPVRLMDSDTHAKDLRRMARKIGHPAGDVPAVMRAAADRLDELERLVSAFQRAEAGG